MSLAVVALTTLFALSADGTERAPEDTSGRGLRVALESNLGRRAEAQTGETLHAKETAAAEDAALSLLDLAPTSFAFVLDSPEHPELELLRSYRAASVERYGPLKTYLTGRFADWTRSPLFAIRWSSNDVPGEPPRVAVGDPEGVWPATDPFARPRSPLGAAGEAWDTQRSLVSTVSRPDRRLSDGLSFAFETTGPSLMADGFDVFWSLPPDKPVRDWRCRRRPVTIARHGGEHDRIPLVACNDQMEPGAQEALSVLARPTGVARPELPLPEEPDAEAWQKDREWVAGVRLVHPRLVWAVQALADAFPYKTIYLLSGYRPHAHVRTADDASAADASGHRSRHAEARALDFVVKGVPVTDVVAACRKLRDVGCGFYPEAGFVHLDVRVAHSGPAFWIDASAPGEPPKYVDGWPGIEPGGLEWVRGGR